MNSWKTTGLGIVTIVMAIASAARMLLDDDVATMPDWNTVVTAVVAGIGLIFARDNNRTSESVGAK